MGGLFSEMLKFPTFLFFLISRIFGKITCQLTYFVDLIKSVLYLYKSVTLYTMTHRPLVINQESGFCISNYDCWISHVFSEQQ